MATSEARRAAGRRYYERNREKQLAAHKEHYKKPEVAERMKAYTKAWRAENMARYILRNCQKSARQRGQECSLTLQDVEELLAPMACSMTGIPLRWDEPGSPWLPSLDRLDNGKGYTRDNVRLVCWAYNSMRGLWPDEVILEVACSLVTASSSDLID